MGGPFPADSRPATSTALPVPVQRAPGRLLLSIELAACPTEAPRARRLAMAVLAATGMATGAIATVVGELVANAIVHTRLPCTLRVRLMPARAGVRVEVIDPCPAAPKLTAHGVLDQAGRGLALVERIAARWGWTPTGSGKTVWAEI